MQPTRVLEAPSSAADVCSLYIDKSAEKQSKKFGGPEADYKHPTRDLQSSETDPLTSDVFLGTLSIHRLKQPKTLEARRLEARRLEARRLEWSSKAGVEPGGWSVARRPEWSSEAGVGPGGQRGPEARGARSAG